MKHHRPATRDDAVMDDDLAVFAAHNAQVARARGDHAKAERHATQARRRKRRAWMIRRHLIGQNTRPPTVAPLELRPRTATRARGAGRPAGRRAAGPRSGSDPGGSDPDEPSPSRRLAGREDIEHWLDERRRTLTALTATAQDQQLTLERWAA